MKKSLLFVLIAAFAALLVLSGCPTGDDTSSDDESSGQEKDNGGGGDSTWTPPTPPTPATLESLSLPVWSAETPNKANVNEMMTRLWNSDAPGTVQGFIQGQVFSYSAASNILMINGSHVTDSLKTWITTQWGGTSVPVEVEIANGTPAGTADPNWNGAHVIWIDVQSSSGLKSIELAGGGSVAYTVLVLSSSLTLSYPVWSADTPNKANVNEMLARLWSSDAASEVQGLTQGQVFSYSASSDTLTVNKTNVTDGLKTWITTQWGGTSIPLKVECGIGTPAAAADPNWSGARLFWIDVGTLTSGGTKNIELADESSVNFTLNLVE
jgi:hypothetical protein